MQRKVVHARVRKDAGAGGERDHAAGDGDQREQAQNPAAVLALGFNPPVLADGHRRRALVMRRPSLAGRTLVPSPSHGNPSCSVCGHIVVKTGKNRADHRGAARRNDPRKPPRCGLGVEPKADDHDVKGDDMPYYRVTGEIPRKRHIRFNRPDGGLYAEELMGEEGFSSDSSLLYHVHPPTAIVKSEAIADGPGPAKLVPNHPLLPRHYRTQELAVGGDLVLGRQPLAGNEDVTISFVAADAESELYRNSIGDETVYLQSGSARFESVYGAIEASAGDYVVIPRGTIHRWIPAESRSQRAGHRGARAHQAAEAVPVRHRPVP